MIVSLFDLSLQNFTWSTQNRLLYIVEEEHTAGKKARAKPPKPPVFEELKIICLCGNSHGSYYNGTCSYNCKDQVTGEQDPVGECLICQCHCLKATKVTNTPKIKAHNDVWRATLNTKPLSLQSKRQLPS